jgi:2-polyprenyl-3-methyl-5-hydroxy-6-metoxy-1,4-benzoquinol methylase
MRLLRTLLSSFIRKAVYFLLPHSLRKSMIMALIGAERHAPPRDAAGWLLGIHDEVGIEIDEACMRWGNGIHIKHQVMDGIHSFFYERIPSHSSVLDLGCGHGTVANAIALNSDSNVLGIDMNAEAIAHAEKFYQNSRLRFKHGNVFFDIPDSETFDVIVLSSVLEHLENRIDFLKSLVQRFHPVKFLIRVPTFEQHYFKAVKRKLGLFAFVDATHVLEYSPDVFTEEMRQAALKINHLEIRWGDIWAECVPDM